MKTVAVFGIFLVMLTLGCKKELNSDKTLEVKYGQPGNYADNSLVISLDSVLNDSRCPKNVYCIWAGNAEVRLVYSKDNHNVKFVLNTLPSFRTDTVINGYRIKLVDLRPYPVSGIIIKQSDYKAEIKITKE